jgi:hypothetical protein
MIAQSIGVFHADGWVHKSVCSQSVVFFKDRRKQTLMLGSPYLVSCRGEKAKKVNRDFESEVHCPLIFDFYFLY